MEYNQDFLVVKVEFEGKTFQLKSSEEITIEMIKNKAMEKFKLSQKHVEDLYIYCYDGDGNKTSIITDNDIILNTVKITDEGEVIEIFLSREKVLTQSIAQLQMKDALRESFRFSGTVQRSSSSIFSSNRDTTEFRTTQKNGNRDGNSREQSLQNQINFTNDNTLSCIPQKETQGDKDMGNGKGIKNQIEYKQSELETEIKNLTKKVNDLEKENKELKEKNESILSTNEYLTKSKNEIIQKNLSYKEAKKEYENKLKDFEKIKSLNNNFENKIKELKNENSKLLAKNTELKTTLVNTEFKIKSLLQENSSLKDKLSKASDQNSKLIEENVRLNGLIEDPGNKLKNMYEENEKFKKQIKEKNINIKRIDTNYNTKLNQYINKGSNENINKLNININQKSPNKNYKNQLEIYQEEFVHAVRQIFLDKYNNINSKELKVDEIKYIFSLLKKMEELKNIDIYKLLVNSSDYYINEIQKNFQESSQLNNLLYSKKDKLIKYYNSNIQNTSSQDIIEKDAFLKKVDVNKKKIRNASCVNIDKKIMQMRKNFELKKEDYSDDQIKQALDKSKGDINGAFYFLFED